MRNATTDFQLPEDAMRDLSLEEREHIQRVMNSVSRAHTTPQESRRSSSAMYSLPDMDINMSERQQIEQVLNKIEQQNQPPFVISEISKSQLTDSEQIKDTELSEAELAHIAKVNEMAFEATDSIKQHVEQPKKSMFGGFKIGGGALKEAFMKTSQKMNENVNALVQATSAIEKPPALNDLKRLVTPKQEVKPVTDSIESLVEDKFVLRASPPSEPEIGHATLIDKSDMPHSVTSSVDSGFTKTSDDADVDIIDRAVEEDESIAWLQQRIEAMNQTLEAYDMPDFPASSTNSTQDKQKSTCQNVFPLTDDVQSAQFTDFSAGGIFPSAPLLDITTKHVPFLAGDFYAWNMEAKGTEKDMLENSKIESGQSAATFSPSATTSTFLACEKDAFNAQVPSISDFSTHHDTQEDNLVREHFSDEVKNRRNLDKLVESEVVADEGQHDEKRLTHNEEDDVDQTLPHPSSFNPFIEPLTSKDQKKSGMFGSGKKSGGFGLGNFLQKAKQATEQIQAKAQEAAQQVQQAASTGDLSQIGSSLMASSSAEPTRSHSATNVRQLTPTPLTPQHPTMDSSIIPPGMEHLSEEERIKIMAVMACAEIDAASPTPQAAPITKTPAVKPTTPIDDDPLSGLSAEEREQILAVMRMAEADEQMPPPPVYSEPKTEIKQSPPIKEEVKIEPLSPIHESTTQKQEPERHTTATPSKSLSTTSVTFESGYGSSAPSVGSYKSDMSSTSMEFAGPAFHQEVTEKPVVEERIQDNELVESDNYLQRYEAEMDEIDEHITASYADQEKPAIEEDVWMEPGKEYRLPETWAPHPTGKMWTTVFSDDGDVAASEYDETANLVQPTPSAYQEQRTKMSGSPVYHAKTSNVRIAEPQYTEDLIYASRDQQDFLEQYGKQEESQEVQSEIDQSRHSTTDSAFISGDGSFEIQMEDPLSPTAFVDQADSKSQDTQWRGRQGIKSIQPAETGTLQSKRKRTPEIKVTSHEEQQKESDEDSSDAETSPSDDEEYPDQIIEAPIETPISASQLDQEQKRQNEYAQEVLRQIQSFGEAADDEFDVQWANITVKKDQNGHLPADQQQKPIETPQVPSATKTVQSQHINPFLESPEEEESDSVTVEQVNLDSDDIDYNQAIQYYKNSHAELYRPGPVYTIPEGDERAEIKGDQKLKPQLLERRALHSTTVPQLVPEKMKRKQPSDHTLSSTFTSLTQDTAASKKTETPIMPIRTAPAPPEIQEPQKVQVIVSTKQEHRFTTDIHQADDLLPNTHQHQIKTVEIPSSVTPSDAAFLAQTFGAAQRSIESSTLGSQLASADHAIKANADEDTAISSRLKRSPAMILTSDTTQSSAKSVTLPSAVGVYAEEENAIRLLQLHQQQKDPIDMGRRKLPVLPSTQPSTSSNAVPLYYTSSSAPMDKREATSQYAASDHHIRFDVSATNRTGASSTLPIHYHQSPIGRQTGPLSYHPVDPAILPGAQFRTTQQTQRPKQTILGAPRAKSLPTSPKISDAMTTLLFKQELRQALSRRRLEQETVEIEANQREFLIRKALNSGLIPSDCRREIDSIPQVTKCSLPYELVAGARVVPPGFHENQRRQQYGRPSSRSTSAHDQWTTFDLHQYYPTSSKKSVGCQYDVPSSPSFQRRFDNVYSSTTTPHSSPFAQRRQVQHIPKIDSATQTMVASETQTDTTSANIQSEVGQQPRHQLRIPQSSNVYATSAASTSYTAPDLLDATRRYFEEYDRRLKNATDAFSQRRHFQFQDAQTAQEMEWKQEQVRRELEHRKQKVASMIDLRALQQGQNYTSIDPQALLPSTRYGSLPRRFPDYPNEFEVSRQQRPNYYGSLPRNFERSMNANYYDRMCQRDVYNPNYNDDLNTRRGMYGPTQKQADDMLLSQYANYVNNQINAAGFLDDPYESQPVYNEMIPDYTSTQPLQDFTTFERPSQTYMPTYIQSQPVTPFMQDVADPLPRVQPYQSMTYDPRLASTGDYVYSRREQNYGTRPSQPIGNYGNYNYPYRNVRTDSILYPDYANQNLPQRSQYWNTMPASYMSQHNNNYDIRWPTYSQQVKPYYASTQPRPQPQPYSGMSTSMWAGENRPRGRTMQRTQPSRWNY